MDGPYAPGGARCATRPRPHRRARERIRAAREHDPHAWPERDDDRAILVHDDEPIDFVQIPDELVDDDAGATPPLGSPEPGAPDVDAPGGVSGPPEGDARTDRRSARAG